MIQHPRNARVRADRSGLSDYTATPGTAAYVLAYYRACVYNVMQNVNKGETLFLNQVLAFLLNWRFRWVPTGVLASIT